MIKQSLGMALLLLLVLGCGQSDAPSGEGDPAAEAQGLASEDSSVRGFRLYVERENTKAQSAYRALGMEEAPYLMFEAFKGEAKDRDERYPDVTAMVQDLASFVNEATDLMTDTAAMAL